MWLMMVHMSNDNSKVYADASSPFARHLPHLFEDWFNQWLDQKRAHWEQTGHSPEELNILLGFTRSAEQLNLTEEVIAQRLDAVFEPGISTTLLKLRYVVSAAFYFANLQPKADEAIPSLAALRAQNNLATILDKVMGIGRETAKLYVQDYQRALNGNSPIQSASPNR